VGAQADQGVLTELLPRPPRLPTLPKLGDRAMRIKTFDLERYFARWEFNVRYLLCASDIEGVKMADLLQLADEETSRLWEEMTLGYTESLGHPLLRREIASMYEGISPDEVVVFGGAQEAIFAFMNVAVGPGDHAIVTWPGYQSLYEVARAAGAEVTLLPLEEERGFELDIDALRRAMRANTRLLVINFPHNPTGAVLHPDTLEAVLALAEDSDAYVLSDEVYRMLELAGPTLPSAVEKSRRAISLGVMSKVYGLAGLRVGWLAGRDRELLARCAAYKDYLSICTSGPSEILALMALRARSQLVQRSRKILLDNLVHLDRFFRDWAGTFAWVRPRAGSVGFPKILRGLSADELARELVEDEGVLIVPGSVFGDTGNHFRIGFGRTNLPEALAGLERFAERRLGR
jgi:aspartate/methionine/tyrosine aminotransferase